MKIHHIESAKNPVYRSFLSLLTSKGIGESGMALIFGEKAVAELIKEYPSAVEGLIMQPKMPKEMNDALSIDQVYEVGEGLFEKLDVFGTRFPIALTKLPKIEGLSKDTEYKGCSVFVPFQDPANVGALLRSAAGFGVNQVILGPGAAHPFHPKSSRAASGTLFKQNYFRIKNVLDLQNFFERRIALDASGENISEYSFPKNFLLIPGTEGPGLSVELKKISTSILRIPLLKQIDSLNAMVATSIALFAWRSKNL